MVILIGLTQGLAVLLCRSVSHERELAKTIFLREGRSWFLVPPQGEESESVGIAESTHGRPVDCLGRAINV